MPNDCNPDEVPPERRGSPARPVLNPLETTGALLVRARGGDVRARDQLAARYLTALKRWAHGRLPTAARDLVDTDDVFQSALYRAMTRLDHFENRGDGAFLAYMRQILLNQIRDESRRARRRPAHDELPDDLSTGESSPLEQLIGREKLALYESSLSRLNPSQREAIIMRLELGLRYREIAEAMGLSTGNAARLLIARGLVRLTAEMGGKK